MFDGFVLAYADLDEVRIRYRVGGSGSPVVLLHGHPRTHTTWHAVAPLLGHDRFAVVGHDRGGAVAYRTALDHADAVTHLVVMDALPVVEHLDRTDATFARAWWHWWFLAQAEKPAERVINADSNAWYSTPAPDEMARGNHEDVWQALRDPAVVHAMAEDYRAGLGVDRDHDAADRANGRRIVCPMLLLESADDDLDIHGDPAAIWAPWVARPLEHRLVPSGHHQAEQAPETVADLIDAFLT